MNPTTQESDKKNRTVKRNGKSRESFEPENQALQDNSERDWLTQLYKREAMERLCNAWLLAKQTGTFILMDLDSFKRINDRYGHITGDQVLQKVSYVLTKMLPGDSLIGRVSGDEFAVLLSGQDEKKSSGRIVWLSELLHSGQSGVSGSFTVAGSSAAPRKSSRLTSPIVNCPGIS